MRQFLKVNRRAAIGLVGGGAAGGMLLRHSPAWAGQGLAPMRQRVEWRVEPVGLDVLRPRFTWELSGDERAFRQVAYRVLVASSLEALQAGRGDVWDSGRVSSSELRAVPADDLRLASHAPYHWSVKVWGESGAESGWGPPQRFVTGILPAESWAAEWVGAKLDPELPPHVPGSAEIEADTIALPLFRKSFQLDRRPARAILSVCGLGQYVARVNGGEVAESLLNPAWTDYRKTVLYNSYEVTDQLQAGENVLGIMLGNGMYHVPRKAGRYTKFVDSFGAPKFILCLDMFDADGNRRRIVSDASWSTRPGPIVFSSIYGGEDADGRLSPDGWDRPGFTADEGWHPALRVSGPGGKLQAQNVEPIVIHERLRPVAVTEPRPGVYVYDFGENFSGRPELAIAGPAGATIRLSPAEALTEEGLASQRSYNARPDAAVYFEYTLAGGGEERFVPQFSYHGFRYLQVDGAVPADRPAEGKPIVQSLLGQFVFADLPEVGTFESSNELLVAIHELIDKAVVSNSFAVLTDCPHREKLGWLEQTHLNASTVLYNRDAITLYEKMQNDIADAQEPDGMVPGIAPQYVAFLNPDGSDTIWRNSPEWGAAAILAPWAAYRTYGDLRVLEHGYPAMQRYVDYLASRAEGHIIDFGMGDWYDVGPADPGPSQLTSRALTGTATYFEALSALAAIAGLLGKAGEAAGYRARAGTVAAAFNARFFDPAAGKYDTGSQTANAMPLALGLVPPGREAAVLDHLVRSVRATGNGVTAGDVGFHYVVAALSEAGRNDVIYDMMTVTDRPSYGYQIAHGATALAEAWSADPTKSLNHFMLGHGEGWLFGSLAGISVDFSRPEAQRIRIAPAPVQGLGGAGASYHSVFGKIASRWQRSGAALVLDAEIPAGARATVIVPTPRAEAVQESGGPATKAAGVLSSRSGPGGLALVVGSGRYRFLAPA